MKLEGSHTLNAGREKVWSILTDPERVARHLPGCESMEEVEADTYDVVLNVGMGPVRGTYRARLRLSDKQPPASYTLGVEGQGKPGHVKGSGQVTLEESDGRTVVRYEGNLQFGGMIARVGQRMLGSVANQMTRRFFTGLSAEAEAG